MAENTEEILAAGELDWLKIIKLVDHTKCFGETVNFIHKFYKNPKWYTNFKKF